MPRFRPDPNEAPYSCPSCGNNVRLTRTQIDRAIAAITGYTIDVVRQLREARQADDTVSAVKLHTELHAYAELAEVLDAAKR